MPSLPSPCNFVLDVPSPFRDIEREPFRWFGGRESSLAGGAPLRRRTRNRTER